MTIILHKIVHAFFTSEEIHYCLLKYCAYINANSLKKCTFVI